MLFLEVEAVVVVEVEDFIEPLLESLCVFVVVVDVGDDDDDKVDVEVKIILFIKRYHIVKGFVNVTINIKLK